MGVLNAFHVNKGYNLNSKIWNQHRMMQVTFYNRLTLNPLMLYSQYFESLQGQRNFLLSGPKGIGKSFSFITYSHLTFFLQQVPF